MNTDGNSLDKEIVLRYYTVKRSFLFLDEWLFYYTLYTFYKQGFHKITLGILIYGLCCIYTSYKNIDKLEEKIISLNQNLFLVPDKYFSEKLMNIWSIFTMFVTMYLGRKKNEKILIK